MAVLGDTEAAVARGRGDCAVDRRRSSLVGNLGNYGASADPGDANQVIEADKRAVQVVVFGNTSLPGAIIYGNIVDGIAIGLEECWHIAVHAGEEG